MQCERANKAWSARPLPTRSGFLSGSRNARRLGFLAAAWLSLVIAGMAVLVDYAGRPGNPGAPAAVWPPEAQLPTSGAACRLVLFAHPKCPCTRATLDELAGIMNHCGRHLDCHLLFIQPEETPPGWARTDIWRSASAIPGVLVQADVGGRLAHVFGADTSGHAMLYDPEGRLRFAGGITPARGHRGSNLGRSTIVALAEELAIPAPAKPRPNPLHDPAPAVATNRVFGCPLFAPPPETAATPQLSRRGR